MKRLLSIFDITGNWSKPYADNGWEVTRIDIQNGFNLHFWDYKRLPCNYFNGILIAEPCDDFAISGAKHFKEKDSDGRTFESLSLVYKSLAIVAYFKPGLTFWTLENPMSRIHKLVEHLGEIKFKFHPTDFAGYIGDSDRYNKTTWLWGEFTKPIKHRLEPLEKDNPGWKKFGGKSLRTKNERSKTPLGFAMAFYKANSEPNVQASVATGDDVPIVAQETETFEEYIIQVRDKFVLKVNEQDWNTELRMEAENILIAYDQMRNKLFHTKT